ncbi:heme/hemin ABC transporter substrate-binding protein [Oceanisphaera pacifica]|uniref:ABC transporter substrate-binding protein n=1 Tax=Oceanisphaera pacifica TaxID=2818389 RepID=A0ABS3NEB2_9GAMM|nr:ABC transporter substrate-binding protein [Oceanisphaera pacifica]MBO1518923.1 ABC transporter substrate-binding protein [Oceanisphaera pacifica]
MIARLLLPLVLLATGTVHADASRLLSAGSSVTELVFALDAGQHLVAVDSTSALPQDSELPRLGYHRQLSAEGILSTQPTLVIGSDEMGPPTTLKLIRQAGIQVASLPEAMSIAELQTNITHLGELLDRTKQAAQLHQQINTRAQALNTKIEQPKRTIFLLIGDGATVQIAGRNTLADAMIATAGGTNPAIEQVEGYKPVAMETIVAMAPEVILVSRRHLTDTLDDNALFKQFPLLRQTPAADHNAIVPINGKALIGGFGLSTLSEAERLHQNWLSH